MNRFLISKQKKPLASLIKQSITLRTFTFIVIVIAGCTPLDPKQEGIAPKALNQSLNHATQHQRTFHQHPEHQAILDEFGGLYHHKGSEQAIARIMGRIIASSDKPGASYRAFILNSPTVNAFALPHGGLYISRGLLALAQDEAELGAVIAHEIAHITHEHAKRRIEHRRTQHLMNHITENFLNEAQHSKTSKHLEASFSQRQELEADKTGIQTLAKAGYDPFAASRFLEKMAHFNETVKASTLKTSTTHPSTPLRIQKAKYHARRFGAPGIGALNEKAYLKNIEGLLFADDPKQGFIKGRDFISPTMKIKFTAPKNYTLENTHYAVLGLSQQNEALRFDYMDVPKAVPLYDFMQSGWIEGLRPETIIPIKNNLYEAVYAEAQNQGWTFSIALIRVFDVTYRFVFASEKNSATLKKETLQTIQSFQHLSAQQRATINPQYIKIIEIKKGVPFSKHVPNNKRSFFRALNGIHPKQTISSKTRLYKQLTE